MTDTDQIIEGMNGMEEQPTTALSKRESDNGFMMKPTTMSDAMQLCKFLAGSQLVPSHFRNEPASLFLAINYGGELGLSPTQSIYSVKVINGTPTVDTKTHLALARQHPDFEWILEDNEAFAYAKDNVAGWEHLKETDPETTSVCVVKRKDQPVVVREFSAMDVAKAGLGNVHKTYPKDMRKYRVRGRALEATFGEVTKGFGMTELEEENVKVYGENYENQDKVVDETMAKANKMAEIVKNKVKKKASNSASNEPKEEQASKDATQEAEVIEEQDTEATEEITGDEDTVQIPLEEMTNEQLLEVLTDEDFPFDKGAGWYLLSNGDTIRGESDAMEAQADIWGEQEQVPFDEPEDIEINVELISSRAKEKFGTKKMAWYKELKKLWQEINPEADFIIDLSQDQLVELYQSLS